MERVAIIGAGPAGLTTARFLSSEGFEPVIFERASRSAASGPATAASAGLAVAADQHLAHPHRRQRSPHEPGTAVYPTNQEVGDYLGVTPRCSGSTSASVSRRGRRMSRDRPRTLGDSQHRPGAAARREEFDRVVVATGRYHRPHLPEVPGLAAFTGTAGAIHAGHTRTRTLTAGGACWSQAAPSAPSRSRASSPWPAPSASSRPIGGSATCCRSCWRACPRTTWHSRGPADWPPELLPPEASRRGNQGVHRHGSAILRSSARRRRRGRVRGGNHALASTTCRSSPKGGSRSGHGSIGIDGRRVTFGDGIAEAFDAIVFADRLQLDLPFLDRALAGRSNRTKST